MSSVAELTAQRSADKRQRSNRVLASNTASFGALPDRYDVVPAGSELSEMFQGERLAPKATRALTAKEMLVLRHISRVNSVSF